jgi:nucleotide-binding universal stress UspA family protein
MYKTIMVPTHGEDTERPALAAAVNLALKWNAELRLVQVDTTDLEAGTTGFVETEDFTTARRAAREKRLTALVSECRAWGVAAVPVMEEGPAGPALTRYAESSGVDLIVIASHARGGLKRVSLGSVTDYVIRHSHVPVLVVKPHATFVSSLPGADKARILVPLDGSALAEGILPHVESLALGLNATVTLLQILSPFADPHQAIMDPAMPWWETQVASGQTYLSRVAEYLTGKGLTVHHDVVSGERIPEGIISYARRENVDLIALATRGTGGLRRLVLGAVADEVSRKSPISVLVFHPGLMTTETHDRITPREAVG